jgi:hypothetical protein
VLVHVERDVAMLDLLRHVPLEEIAERAWGPTMVVPPARDSLPGEPGGVRLEAFDVPDAGPLGLVGQESIKVSFQRIDPLRSRRRTPRPAFRQT